MRRNCTFSEANDSIIITHNVRVLSGIRISPDLVQLQQVILWRCGRMLPDHSLPRVSLHQTHNEHGQRERERERERGSGRIVTAGTL